MRYIIKKVLAFSPVGFISHLFLRFTKATLPGLLVLVTAKLIQDAEIIMGEIRFSIPKSLVTLLLLLFFSFLIDTLSEQIKLLIKHKVELGLYSSLYAKLSKLPYVDLENENRLNHIQQVFREPSKQFLAALDSLIQLIEITISMFTFILVLASQSLLILPIFTVLSIFILFFAFQSGKESYEAFEAGEIIERRNDYLEDVLLGREKAAERSTFSYHKLFIDEWKSNKQEYIRVNAKPLHRMTLKISLIKFISYFVVSLFGLSLFLLLKKGNINGAFFVSSFGASLSLINLLSNDVFWTYKNLKECLFFASHYHAFMKLEESDTKTSRNRETEIFRIIEVKDLTFTYPGNTHATLKNINLRLERGKTHALVGDNGSGKTTLVKLLLGLYPSYSGEILIDGKELRSFSRNDINAIYAVAFQDFYHLELPVYAFLQSSNDEEILRLFHSLDLSISKNQLALTLGKLSPDSVELSRGEWQKLLLARTLLKKNTFKILDEPTSAIDPEQEIMLYDHFDTFRGKEGALLITHRLGAAIHADIIYVLQDGSIIERGTHRTLLNNERHYAKMFRTQGACYEN